MRWSHLRSPIFRFAIILIFASDAVRADNSSEEKFLNWCEDHGRTNGTFLLDDGRCPTIFVHCLEDGRSVVGQCQDGRVFDGGNCVEAPDECIGPSRELETDQRCGSNEIYLECGPACQATCRPDLADSSECGDCMAGCFCKSGHLRDDYGRCVSEEACSAVRVPRTGDIFRCPTSMANGDFASTALLCATSYYRCTNGQPKKLYCDGGQIFDAKERICRPVSELPNCQFDCSDKPSKSMHAIGCTRFYWWCWEGLASKVSCAHDRYFNPANKQCDFRENVASCKGRDDYVEEPAKALGPKTTAKPTPPTTTPVPTPPPLSDPVNCTALKNGNYPHPTKPCADYYYTCSNSASFRTPCPATLYYHPKLDQCVYKENVPGCKEGYEEKSKPEEPPPRSAGDEPFKERPVAAKSTSPVHRHYHHAHHIHHSYPVDCSNKKEGNYPDPNAACAGHYYSCSSGQPFLMSCPASLYYHAEAGECRRWNEVPACGNVDIPAPVTTTTTPAPPVLPDFKEKQHHHHHQHGDEHHHHRHRGSECSGKADGNYADPAHPCSSTYFTCTNQIRYVRPCPAGLFYDDGSDQCLRKNEVPACGGARPNKTSDTAPYMCPKPDGIFAHPHYRCNRAYIVCQNGQWNSINCETEGHIFDPEKGACAHPRHVRGCDTDFCVGKETGTRYPVPTGSQCTSNYIVCVHGTAVYQPCPSPLVFSSATGNCEWAVDVPACGIVRVVSEGESRHHHHHHVPTGGNHGFNYHEEKPVDGYRVSGHGHGHGNRHGPHITGESRPSTPESESSSSSTKSETRTHLICRNKPDGDYAFGECSNEYWSCGAGIPYPRQCPAGLIFDAEKDRCDRPENIKRCRHSRPESKPHFPHGSRPDTEWSSSSNSETRSHHFCREKPDGDYPVGKCLNQYWSCGAGIVYPRQCPAGLVFDGVKDRCDRPDAIEQCRHSRPSTTEVDWSSPPSNSEERSRHFCRSKPDGDYPAGKCSNEYWTCGAGIPYPRQCPAGLVFDAARDRCENSENIEQCRHSRPHSRPHFPGHSRRVPEWPLSNVSEGRAHNFCRSKPDGDYPSSECSNQYWSCGAGIPYPRQCPPDLVFDGIRDRCDRPEYVEQCRHRHHSKPAHHHHGHPYFTEPTPVPEIEVKPSSVSPGFCDKLPDGYYPTSPCSAEAVQCKQGRSILTRCSPGDAFDGNLRECRPMKHVESCRGQTTDNVVPTPAPGLESPTTTQQSFSPRHPFSDFNRFGHGYGHHDNHQRQPWERLEYGQKHHPDFKNKNYLPPFNHYGLYQHHRQHTPPPTPAKPDSDEKEDVKDPLCHQKQDGWKMNVGPCSPNYGECRHGRMKIMQCPDGHLFDRSLDRCQVASQVDECNPTTTPPTMTTTKKPGFCDSKPDGNYAKGACINEYYHCRNGETFESSCTHLRHVFHPHHRQCEPAINVSTCFDRPGPPIHRWHSHERSHERRPVFPPHDVYRPRSHRKHHHSPERSHERYPANPRHKEYRPPVDHKPHHLPEDSRERYPTNPRHKVYRPPVDHQRHHSPEDSRERYPIIPPHKVYRPPFHHKPRHSPEDSEELYPTMPPQRIYRPSGYHRSHHSSPEESHERYPIRYDLRPPPVQYRPDYRQYYVPPSPRQEIEYQHVDEDDRRIQYTCRKANQIYTTCGADCESTCENPQPTCDQPCVAGCKCRPGYVLSSNDGDCIPSTSCSAVSVERFTPTIVEDSEKTDERFTLTNVDDNEKTENDDDQPRCFGPNEIIRQCANCQPTCSNLKPTCGEEKCTSGCGCRNGYIRSWNNRCVRREMCVFYARRIDRSDNSDESSHSCNDGHDHGCASKTESIISDEDSSEDKCPNPGETYSKCKAHCQPTCEDPDLKCSKKRKCVPGCVCLDDYLRSHTGACVKKSKCFKVPKSAKSRKDSDDDDCSDSGSRRCKDKDSDSESDSRERKHKRFCRNKRTGTYKISDCSSKYVYCKYHIAHEFKCDECEVFNGDRCVACWSQRKCKRSCSRNRRCRNRRSDRSSHGGFIHRRRYYDSASYEHDYRFVPYQGARHCQHRPDGEYGVAPCRPDFVQCHRGHAHWRQCHVGFVYEEQMHQCVPATQHHSCGATPYTTDVRSAEYERPEIVAPLPHYPATPYYESAEDDPVVYRRPTPYSPAPRFHESSEEDHVVAPLPHYPATPYYESGEDDHIVYRRPSPYFPPTRFQESSEEDRVVFRRPSPYFPPTRFHESSEEDRVVYQRPFIRHRPVFSAEKESGEGEIPYYRRPHHYTEEHRHFNGPLSHRFNRYGSIYPKPTDAPTTTAATTPTGELTTTAEPAPEATTTPSPYNHHHHHHHQSPHHRHRPYLPFQPHHHHHRPGGSDHYRANASTSTYDDFYGYRYRPSRSSRLHQFHQKPSDRFYSSYRRPGPYYPHLGIDNYRFNPTPVPVVSHHHQHHQGRNLPQPVIDHHHSGHHRHGKNFCQAKPDGDYPAGKCSNQYLSCGAGILYPRQCPAGLIYDGARNRCDGPNAIEHCRHSRPSASETEWSSSSNPADQSRHFCRSKPDGDYPAGKCSNEYWSCGSGILYPRQCPSGLVFVGAKDRCEQPEDIEQCRHHSKPVHGWRENPPRSNYDQYGFAHQWNERHRLPHRHHSRVEVDVEGPCRGLVDGSFVSLGKCRRDYAECIGGVAVPRSCAEAKHIYDHVTKQCIDRRDEPLCRTLAPEPTPTRPTGGLSHFCMDKEDGYYRHPHNCTKFIQCHRKDAFVFPCSSGLVFNAKDGVKACDYPRNVPECVDPNLGTGIDYECEGIPDGGFLRHPHKCHKFRRCVHGQLVDFDCPDETVFNIRLNVCDHKYNVPECKHQR